MKHPKIYGTLTGFFLSMLLAGAMRIAMGRGNPQKGMVIKKEWRLVVELDGKQTSYEVSPAYFSRVSLGDSVDFSLGVPRK